MEVFAGLETCLLQDCPHVLGGARIGGGFEHHQLVLAQVLGDSACAVEDVGQVRFLFRLRGVGTQMMMQSTTVSKRSLRKGREIRCQQV